MNSPFAYAVCDNNGVPVQSGDRMYTYTDKAKAESKCIAGQTVRPLHISPMSPNSLTPKTPVLSDAVTMDTLAVDLMKVESRIRDALSGISAVRAEAQNASKSR